MMKEKEGFLPDFAGNPILATCNNCCYLTDQSDGYEYGPPIYACEKKGREKVSNLKYFPFKTPQKCCKLSQAYTVDWSKEL